MTYGEFFRFKGLLKEEDIRAYIHTRGWWSDSHCENIAELKTMKISNFEVFCDYPFWKLNRVYNLYYDMSRSMGYSIGSTYDWLSETATDEIVEKYLGKENY